MKIQLTKSFIDRLNKLVDFIAHDKPYAARQFKQDILNRIKKLNEMYFRNRKSIHFNDDNIREIIFKGFKIIYKVYQKENKIVIFALLKNEESVR